MLETEMIKLLCYKIDLMRLKRHSVYCILHTKCVCQRQTWHKVTANQYSRENNTEILQMFATAM